MARRKLRFAGPLLAALACAIVLPAAASAGAPADGAHPQLSPRLAKLESPALRAAPPSTQARAVQLPPHGAGSLQHVGDGVVVEIRFDTGADAVRNALEAAGARILHVSRRYQTVSAAVGPADLAKVSDVPGVKGVTEALAPVVGGSAPQFGDVALTGACPSGAATSEGDSILHAVDLRASLGIDGAGQKVGVISDSYDLLGGASGDVSTGDLPGAGNPCGRSAPVDVIHESASGGEDEGRAMLQIVHDLAPGASLAFSTSGLTVTAMADNIRDLANAGATVISDDISFLNEPFFQKGPIDVAVDDVNAAGVSYFSDAANTDIRVGTSPKTDVASWESPAFRASSAGCPAIIPAGDTCEDFDPSAGDDPTYAISHAGGTLRLLLQWAQPWGGVSTDLDLFVLDSSDTIIRSSSKLANVATTQQPSEIVAPNLAAGTYHVVIARSAASGGNAGTPRLKLNFFQNGPQTTFPTEYATSDPAGIDPIVGPTIFGHNGAENGSSVAAAKQSDLSQPEDYSARGPVTHYFGPVAGVSPAAALASPQVSSKPDITAVDCTSNTFFGVGNVFCGTSAASPHAAGVAALMRSAEPSLSPADVRALQAAGASPIAGFGPTAVGAGLLNAAVSAPNPRVQLSGPPRLTANRSPAFTFAASRPVAFSCKVDGGGPGACTSPFAPAALPDGAHTVTVTGTDGLGHNGAASSSFTVDATPPAVAVTAGPRGPTRATRPMFRFSSTEPTATFMCHFDAEPIASCHGAGSDRPPAALRDGAHQFVVVATDAAGNFTPAQRSFTVDTKKPTARIKRHPARKTAKHRATFSVSASESGSKLQCKLDRAKFKSCGKRKTLSVRRGRHTFQVRAVDRAGNVGKPKRFTWRVTR